MARFSSRLAQIAAWVLLPLALAGCLRTIDTSPLQPTPPGAVSNNPQPTPTQQVAAVPTELPSATPVVNQPPTEVPQASPTLEQPTNVVAPSPTEVINQPPTEVPQPSPTLEQPTNVVAPSPTGVINQPPTEVPQASPTLEPTLPIVPTATEVIQPSTVTPPTQVLPTDTPVPPPTELPTPTEANPGGAVTATLPAGGGSTGGTPTLPAGGGGPAGTAVPMATNAVFFAPAQDGAQGTIDDQCRYTVAKNDRLIRIGLRFNRTIAQLMNANHLLSAGLIYPDQILIIPDCQLP